VSEVAIGLSGLSKRFRIPLDRSTSLKYRVAHPRSSSRYRDLLALKDVSFEVPEGQFLGIIGHNGSGKSTLLKILARIYAPTSGSVVIHGHVSPFLELGVGFHSELSARENVYLNGAVLGLTRRELRTRLDEIVGFAELDSFVDQKLKNFSSGMQVRLAFSIAIQVNAAILLMDEVLAVGDASFQEKCFEVFARYKREGRTVILVTHDLGAVDRYCDRAILFERGELVRDGASGEVTGYYRQTVGHRSDLDGRERAAVNRWGSGEAEITDVTYLNDAGVPQKVFSSGSPMTVQIHYQVHGELQRLVCGLAFHRSDGLNLAGPNTLSGRTPITPPGIGSTGTVSYRIDALPLLTGGYTLTVNLYPQFGEESYDYVEQGFPFRVVDDIGRPGLVDLGGKWSASQASN